MPALNWDAFACLPGAATANFEQLCRGAVRLNYGRYGQFVARANQPGIEFHLRLHTDCALGKAGRWFGWQCRWWNIAGGTPIGQTRRGKIVEAIEKTEEVLPGLTDWVLVTRRPLTAGDQDWFYAINSSMRLELANSDDVEAWLTGDADVLRSTYFGELVLTADRLAELQRGSARRVGNRWMPEVHQTVDAERAIRRMLGEEESWTSLMSKADELTRFADATESLGHGLPPVLAGDIDKLIQRGRSDAELLRTSHLTVVDGDLDAVVSIIAQQREPVPRSTPTVVRQVLGLNHPVAMAAINLVAVIRDAEQLLTDLAGELTSPMAVVVADAGCGKTQLSAQVTVAGSDRPAGVLLHGRELAARASLNHLARRVNIGTEPVPSFEALLAALDAAGRRARARLPLVIDGLNEAEDPREWRAHLAELLITLGKYPYVLLVCTLRGEFSDIALPDDAPDELEIPDFGLDGPEAVRRYFKHYRIIPGDAALPLGLLRHPLTLRIYCEVANPTRTKPVGVEHLPYSLSPIFAAYLDTIASRIGETSPVQNRYWPQDVKTALDAIGNAMWERRTRDLPQADVTAILGDQGRLWENSMLRALEQDGVLLRRPQPGGGDSEISVAFDQLAGHVIATALINVLGTRGITDLMREPDTIAALTGPIEDRHPLASDIIDALAALLPGSHGPQLWELVGPQLNLRALRAAADLDADNINARTVTALANAIPALAGRRDIFDRLRETRGSPAHPLNAEFLDRVLRGMSIADRDLRWTEWLRARNRILHADFDLLEHRWRSEEPTDPGDALRARWAMWNLTSTVRNLRDHATRALYWYGRKDPAGLFSIAHEALTINDPYVAERVTAAAYGVAMAHQTHDPDFDQAIGVYLTGLQEALTTNAAFAPTSHALTRHYVAGTVAFAAAYYPTAVPAGLTNPPSFAAGPAIALIPDADPAHDEVDRTMRMDFHNYTIGRLFPDRRNYDMKHPGHLDATAYVASTVWELGWRKNRFETVEREIDAESEHRYSNTEGKVERYGKKYGWIGFHTLAGVLGDRGDPIIQTQRFEVDIDPSFPEPLSPGPVSLSPWARPTGQDAYWLKRGSIATPIKFINPDMIGDAKGPWVLADGFLESKDVTTGRNVFGILTAVLVDPADAADLMNHLETVPYPGRNLVPEAPSAYYVFAGEIPWSPQFCKPDSTHRYVDTYTGSITVGTHTIEMEMVSHLYAWEDYHSVTNQASPAKIPSKPLSTAQHLRGMPQRFDQVDPAGVAATMTVGAPDGFSGELLYVREDVLRAYAGNRAILFFGWGERRLYSTWPNQPSDMARKVYRKEQNVWRVVKQMA